MSTTLAASLRKARVLVRDLDDLPEPVAHHRKRVFRELMDAQAKQRAGTYGQCEQCQQPIGKRRLAALPGARYCICCQRGFEATLAS